MKKDALKVFTKIDIERLTENFINKKLPKSEWTHEAHLIIALWHNMTFDFEPALSLVKSRIKIYNESVGTQNTDESGYHETLTIFWMISSKNFLIQNSNSDISKSVNDFLRSMDSQKNVCLGYYSKKHLFSKEARKIWRNGDLKRIKLMQELNNHLNLSDQDFISNLKDCSLSPILFSHEAHLRLVWIHIKNAGIESALEIICNQIASYVEQLGAKDKFNKTLTIAAIKVVHHFIQKSKSDNFIDFMLEFPQLKSNFKDLISFHYGFDIYNSEKAKTDYLEPDLMPFE